MSIKKGIFFFVLFSAFSMAFTMTVTATAYTSTRNQCDSTPCIGAWGDNICKLHQKGIGIIAVSRDLERLGLRRNSKVKINGKTYIVKDRMHRRWKRRIDIYMGRNHKKMRKFGKRKVQIVF